MANPEQDFYHVLDVPRSASQTEIKKAYRRMARKYHPDVNPNDSSAAAKFKMVKKAYDILSDPVTRTEYDKFGTVRTTGSGAPPGQGAPSGAGPGRGAVPRYDAANSSAATTQVQSQPSEDVFSGGGFDDLYRVVTERGPPLYQNEGPKPGADLRYDLEISFEDAAFGIETEIDIPQLLKCTICGGAGVAPGGATVQCPVCRGTGEIRMNRQTQFGSVVSARVCGKCQGRGTTIQNPCLQCNGSGRLQRIRRILIKVPPGVDDGAHLRIRGKGAGGVHGGPPGDLYVIVHVREHEIFERHGDEIICEVPITFPQASLGAEIEVPTLEGTAKIKIPSGTQNGTIFRLRGKGIPNMQKQTRGDQHVKVTVVVPKRIPEKARNFLLKYAQFVGEDMNAIMGGRAKKR